MSRGYRVLALALVAVLALMGLARLVSGGSESTSGAAPDTGASVTTSAPAATVPATSTPPSTSATTVPATTEPATTEPATTEPASTVPASTVPAEGCTASGASAVVDREAQRAWLCQDGGLVSEFPITSAWSMPDPGTYPVYAKDMNAWSNFGGHPSTMTHFVAFTYGKNTGARVAFHSMPVLASGEFVQPLDSVGDLSRRGESSGCIRVLPDDAVRIWDTLAIGDSVVVLN